MSISFLQQMILCSWFRVIPGWPQTKNIAKGDLEVLIIQPPLLEYWDYKYEPSCIAYVVIGVELMALCMISKQSTK